MPAIEVRDLVRRYGTNVAVDGVSFTVEPGEIFALLGPNGAGKTTTVEILEGLRARDAGDVRVLGHDPVRDRRTLAHRVGVMPQTGDLQMGIRTAEAVRLYASFYAGAEEPGALMTALGLERCARRTYRRLSGGERKRLSLALALVGRPEVAFLDEPTAGMDVEGRSATWERIRLLKERDATVVVTTHLLEEAERHADRVAILHRGRIAAIGAPSELASRASGVIAFAVGGALDAAELSRRLGTAVRADGGSRYEVDAGEVPTAVAARITAYLSESGVDLRRLEVGARSLEDVYTELTG